jgi:hypothetical protein
MSLVQLHMPGNVVEIYLQTLPRPGEEVHFDGTDPEIPEGSWYVRSTVHFIGLRGTDRIRVVLSKRKEPLL